MRKATAGVQEAQSGLEEVERAMQAAERAREAVQARAEIASRTLSRYETLLARRSVAPQEYDEVTARHAAAQADVRRAQEEQAALVARKRQMQARIMQAQAEMAHIQATLRETQIQAPITGLVSARPVEVGNLASPGVVLCTLDAEHYRLEASIQEADSQKIRLGQQATIALTTLGQTLPSRVEAIVPAANPLSRTVTVKLDVPALAGVRAGTYATAILAVGQRQALRVPTQALIVRGQLQGVFVVASDALVQLRLVSTGKVEGGQVEILSGVHAGERIVIEGLERVQEGSRVEEGAG